MTDTITITPWPKLRAYLDAMALTGLWGDTAESVALELVRDGTLRAMGQGSGLRDAILVALREVDAAEPIVQDGTIAASKPISPEVSNTGQAPEKTRVSISKPKLRLIAPNARLKADEEAVWRYLAEWISNTGLSPDYYTVARGCDYAYARIKNIARALEAKGYLRREGERRGLTLQIVKWPEGVTPRVTEGRADGVGNKPRQRETPPPPAPAAALKGVLDSFNAATGRVCVVEGCRNPKQPGRDLCAAHISAKAGPNKRKDMVESYVGGPT